MGRSRRKRHVAFVYKAPVQPEVVYDLRCVVQHFVVTCRTDFQAFHQVAQQKQLASLFQASKSCGRVPGVDENQTDWAEIILYTAARQLCHASVASFLHRLGYVYLLYTLYQIQPQRPRARLPVDDNMWPSLEGIVSEVRERRIPDGLGAIQTLWLSDALRHTKMHRVLCDEWRAQELAEQAADDLPAKLDIAEDPILADRLNPCLLRLEAAYNVACNGFGSYSVSDNSIADAIQIYSTSTLKTRKRTQDDAIALSAHDSRTMARLRPYTLRRRKSARR